MIFVSIDFYGELLKNNIDLRDLGKWDNNHISGVEEDKNQQEKCKEKKEKKRKQGKHIQGGKQLGGGQGNENNRNQKRVKIKTEEEEMERKTTKMRIWSELCNGYRYMYKYRKDKEKKTYTKENGKERWRWVKMREKVMKQSKRNMQFRIQKGNMRRMKRRGNQVETETDQANSNG